jgi:serine/threonine-protein kinase
MNARREPPAPRISLAEVFDRALDVAPAERAAFVREACRADPAREAEVLALLASDASAAGPLDSPLGAALEPLLASGAGQAPAPDAPPTAPPGSRIGPYAIIEVLGRGGMGTVYLAERADGAYSQRVALKLVSAGTHSADLERRFLRERQILARLDHPGIARLLDGGLTADGRPYLVMQLVEGTPITQWADTHALDIDDRLALLLRVCDAVQYAHRQLIVHRDLKPANILVTADGDVRLLDFGIATLLSPDDAQEQVTRTGMLLLTPEYAAPEQLRGEPVTTAGHAHLRRNRCVAYAE